eukprot:2587534-Alexandrium_andersonii.AAC.1
MWSCRQPHPGQRPSFSQTRDGGPAPVQSRPIPTRATGHPPECQYINTKYILAMQACSPRHALIARFRSP